MSPTPQKSKRARHTIHRPDGTTRLAHTQSMVVFTPTRTRRGKIAYWEVDASPYYRSSDGEEETLGRKIPNTPSGSCGTSSAVRQEDLLEGGNACDFWEDCNPQTSRKKKVRVCLVTAYANDIIY